MSPLRLAASSLLKGQTREGENLCLWALRCPVERSRDLCELPFGDLRGQPCAVPHVTAPLAHGVNQSATKGWR
jgi:hypothetical protein